MDVGAALRLRYISYSLILAGLTAVFVAVTYLHTALYFTVLYSAFFAVAAFVLSLVEDRVNKALSSLPQDSPLREERRPKTRSLVLGTLATLIVAACFIHWRISMLEPNSYLVVALDYDFYAFIFLALTCLWAA